VREIRGEEIESLDAVIFPSGKCEGGCGRTLALRDMVTVEHVPEGCVHYVCFDDYAVHGVAHEYRRLEGCRANR
jgi:hypothetical protein